MDAGFIRQHLQAAGFAVDVSVGSPSDTQTWRFSPSSPELTAYLATLTLADWQRAHALRNLRQERNARLTASDWTQLEDVPPSSKAAWRAYRQALRDLPAATPDPANPVWPTPPSA